MTVTTTLGNIGIWVDLRRYSEGQLTRLGLFMHVYEDFSWVSPGKLERLSAANEPWSFYLETMVHFQTAGVTGVVRPVRGGGSDQPPLGPLHVISATQPGSEPNSKESAARLAVLDVELRNAGIGSIRAIGSSFDGQHQEDGRALFGLSDSEACELGRRFGQVAVFAWHGPLWSLLACASNRRTDSYWLWQEAAA